jgi:hypothetical protein
MLDPKDGLPKQSIQSSANQQLLPTHAPAANRKTLVKLKVLNKSKTDNTPINGHERNLNPKKEVKPPQDVVKPPPKLVVRSKANSSLNNLKDNGHSVSDQKVNFHVAKSAQIQWKKDIETHNADRDRAWYEERSKRDREKEREAKDRERDISRKRDIQINDWWRDQTHRDVDKHSKQKDRVDDRERNRDRRKCQDRERDWEWERDPECPSYHSSDSRHDSLSSHSSSSSSFSSSPPYSDEEPFNFLKTPISSSSLSSSCTVLTPSSLTPPDMINSTPPSVSTTPTTPVTPTHSGNIIPSLRQHSRALQRGWRRLKTLERIPSDLTLSILPDPRISTSYMDSPEMGSDLEEDLLEWNLD